MFVHIRAGKLPQNQTIFATHHEAQRCLLSGGISTQWPHFQAVIATLFIKSEGASYRFFVRLHGVSLHFARPRWHQSGTILALSGPLCDFARVALWITARLTNVILLWSNKRFLRAFAAVHGGCKSSLWHSRQRHFRVVCFLNSVMLKASTGFCTSHRTHKKSLSFDPTSARKPAGSHFKHTARHNSPCCCRDT